MVTVTKYVWDPVFDCVTHELDENNNVKAEYHNEPQQYGGVLSQRRGTTSRYHHHDALGSTRFLTDSSGNVTYLHDAWGNLVASTGTTTNPFKWVGKYGYYTDNSTAQVYVRARMYQPTVARWASVDIAYGTIFLSQYPYSINDPSGLSDPSGNCPCCCCVDDIDYTPLKLERYWPAGQERPEGDAARFGRWPVSFQVVATNALVPGPGSPVCEMEWYECSDAGGNRGQIAGQWKKFSPSDGIESGISWPDPPQCPGWFQQFIGDAPTLNEIDGDVKRVNFFVRARSSVGCSCSSSEVSVAFNLVVETVKVNVYNPGTPPKFKPSPPVLKPGLDRTITGCDTLPGVV